MYGLRSFIEVGKEMKLGRQCGAMGGTSKNAHGSHFGSSTQSARSVLSLLSTKRPLCKSSCTALLLGGQLDRSLLLLQVQSYEHIAATNVGDGFHPSVQEELETVAKDFFRHEVGISQVVKHLRQNEHADLAKAVIAQHKCRNLAAHLAGDLDVRIRLDFEIKNVGHFVIETSSNDVAAERSETAVAPASGTWELLVLRLLIADTGRHFNAACTRKKTRDFTA